MFLQEQNHVICHEIVNAVAYIWMKEVSCQTPSITENKWEICSIIKMFIILPPPPEQN